MLRLASRIEEVTVYREGARVVRSAALPEGAARVRVEGLPLSLNATSLRATVRRSARIAVSAHVSLSVAEPDPALPQSGERSVAEATLVRELAAEEVARLRGALTALDRLSVKERPLPAPGASLAPSPLQARRALVALRLDASARIAEALAEAELALSAATERERGAIQGARLASSARNGRPDEVRRAVEVILDGPADAGATLEIAYDVPGARWCPAYTLTVVGDAAVTLAMRAMVAQRTGEDWRDARLVVSTADPTAWCELPELTRLRIGRAQPQLAKRGYRAPPTGAAELYADYDRSFSVPSPAHAAHAAHDTPKESEDDADYDEEQYEEATATGRAPMMMMKSAGRSGATADGPLSPPGAPSPRASMAFGGGGDGAANYAEGRKKRAKGVRMASGAALEAPRAGPLEVDFELLAYARLRMRGGADDARGELIAASAAELELAEVRSPIRAEVEDARRAARLAASDGIADAPAGHTIVGHSDTFDYAYAAPLPCDVPSDGAFHAAKLLECAGRGGVRHVAVPRETPEAFRVLSIESPLDAALPVGPVDVYAGDDAASAAFVLQSIMPPTPPRGRVTLGLGVDQGVKVARNTSYEERATGVLGGGLALEHTIAIDITNTHPRPIAIEIRERVPVTREGDTTVTVEVGPVEPAWGNSTGPREVSGAHAWTLDVAPLGSRTVRARYRVKMAAKLEIVGGNRRES